MSIAACTSIRPRRPRSACSRASSTSCGRRVHRKSSARIRIMSTPPANSAPRNGQPSRISRISPSSKTRLVEANSKTMAAGKLAPLRKSERAIATAAYEQDDDAAPRSVAIPRLRGESDPRVRATALRETRVCTMADRRNPSASGQRTSQSMSKADASALTTAWMITMAAYRVALRLVTKRRGPAFLDVQASIDQKCAGPRHDEGAHDHEAHDAEVHPTDRVPRTPTKIQLLDEQLAQLEQADEERDKDRERGDGEVVENLPHRVRESPRIRLRHKGAVGSVHQRHTGGEDQRQRDQRVDGDVLSRGSGGDGQERDLRRGIEAQPEEETHQVHLPAVRDEPEEPAKEPSQQPTGHQLVLERIPVVLARSHPAEQLEDVQQDDQVHDPDQQQKDTGDARADQSADALQLAVGADHVADHELGGKSERHRDQEHDRRMPKREEESNAEGLLPLLEQLAGGVVDGRDVVRVERMPQAKRVGETAEAEHDGIPRGDQQQHHPPANDMQQGDTAEEAAQSP